MKHILIGLALAGASLAASAVTTFYGPGQKAAFLADTGASSATGAYSAVGFVNAPLTVGSLTLTLPDPGQTRFEIAEWTALLPGAEIGISGNESLNVALAAPVFAFGYDFVEPTVINVNGTFVDSTFTITLLSGSTAVGSATINFPNDVASFVGLSSSIAFDHVQIRETIGGIDNEFYGQFYTAAAVPEPQSWALMLAGLAALGALTRRRRAVVAAGVLAVATAAHAVPVTSPAFFTR